MRGTKGDKFIEVAYPRVDTACKIRWCKYIDTFSNHKKTVSSQLDYTLREYIRLSIFTNKVKQEFGSLGWSCFRDDQSSNVGRRNSTSDTSNKNLHTCVELKAGTKLFYFNR